MIKFIKLLNYILAKKKELITMTLTTLLIVILLIVINFAIFLFTSVGTQGISFAQLGWKGLLHFLLFSVILVRLGYLFVTKKLILSIFEDHEETIKNAVLTFLENNALAKNLTTANEDNFLLKLNSWVENLPKYPRLLATRVLAMIPFYSLYQKAMKSDVADEERAVYIVDEIRNEIVSANSTSRIVIWLAVLPILNWGLLISYALGLITF